MIYFLKAERDSEDIKAGWIKCGTTICLSERLKLIGYEIGHRPTVLGVLDGSFPEERAIHARFAAFRRYGEWFDPVGSEFLGLIRDEARQWDGVDESPRRYSTAIRLDGDVIQKARMVAGLMGMTTPEYISFVVDEQAEADLQREAAKLVETAATRARK